MKRKKTKQNVKSQEKKFSQRYERKLFARKETLINLQVSNILENKPKTNRTPKLNIN